MPDPRKYDRFGREVIQLDDGREVIRWNFEAPQYIRVPAGPVIVEEIGERDVLAGVVGGAKLVDGRMHDVEEKPKKWLWENRIILDFVNTILGEEDVGKSTTQAW